MSVVVKQTDLDTFEVSVAGDTPTSHTVTASEEYVEKLTLGHISAMALVERSFEFLLEREPNTSILKRFDLPLIQQYFSEYEKTISESVGS